MEDYKKKYEEALERAKKLQYGQDTVHGDTNCMEYIFPELRESEDERIRKALIKYYSFDKDGGSHALDNITPKQIVAWLEKQGEQKSALKWNELTWEDINTLEDIINRVHYEYPNGISEKSFCKEVLEYFREYKRDEYLDAKEGEQKSADKVEPKFKVGDWIVFNGLTLFVKEVVKGYYRTISLNGIPNSYDWDIDNVARLWTIQDAKDGDVLACPNDAGDRDVVFIFKNINIDEGWVFCFCASDANGCFCTNNDYVGNSNSTNISPATKEQRDLLFQKMKENGYEWNNEKKELKKIEQKPVEWHKKDEQNLNACLGFIPDAYLCRWLKDIIHVKYDNPVWSEEDDEMLDSIIEEVRYIGDFPDYPTKEENELYDECLVKVEWLKSLKDRVQPQPKQEWKQENTNDLTDFENAMMHIGDSFFGQHAGLDPNDTNAIKEQANILLGLVPKQGWSEEDEKKINNIIRWLALDYYLVGYEAQKFREDSILFLQSLRPQNTWKPSEGQLKVLEIALNAGIQLGTIEEDILRGLIEQLKEL